MAIHGERCFGQEALEWDQCAGLELQGNRKRILGQLCCDQCFYSATYEDQLTGLPNRRSIHKTFNNFRKTYERNGVPFGALVIDLSSFKYVNETMGHQTGDEILRHTASFFKQHARESDDYFVGRQGGDEFVAFLKLTGRGGDMSPQQRLVAATARLAEGYSEYKPVHDYNQNVPEEKKLAMKIGGAVWDGYDLETLLSVADPKCKKKPLMVR